MNGAGLARISPTSLSALEKVHLTAPTTNPGGRARLPAEALPYEDSATKEVGASRDVEDARQAGYPASQRTEAVGDLRLARSEIAAITDATRSYGRSVSSPVTEGGAPGGRFVPVRDEEAERALRESAPRGFQVLLPPDHPLLLHFMFGEQWGLGPVEAERLITNRRDPAGGGGIRREAKLYEASMLLDAAGGRGTSEPVAPAGGRYEAPRPATPMAEVRTLSFKGKPSDDPEDIPEPKGRRYVNPDKTLTAAGHKAMQRYYQARAGFGVDFTEEEREHFEKIQALLAKASKERDPGKRRQLLDDSFAKEGLDRAEAMSRYEEISVRMGITRGDRTGNASQFVRETYEAAAAIDAAWADLANLQQILDAGKKLTWTQIAIRSRLERMVGWKALADREASLRRKAAGEGLTEAEAREFGKVRRQLAAQRPVSSRDIGRLFEDYGVQARVIERELERSKLRVYEQLIQAGAPLRAWLDARTGELRWEVDGKKLARKVEEVQRVIEESGLPLLAYGDEEWGEVRIVSDEVRAASGGLWPTGGLSLGSLDPSLDLGRCALAAGDPLASDGPRLESELAALALWSGLELFGPPDPGALAALDRALALRRVQEATKNLTTGASLRAYWDVLTPAQKEAYYRSGKLPGRGEAEKLGQLSPEQLRRYWLLRNRYVFEGMLSAEEAEGLTSGPQTRRPSLEASARVFLTPDGKLDPTAAVHALALLFRDQSEAYRGPDFPREIPGGGIEYRGRIYASVEEFAKDPEVRDRYRWVELTDPGTGRPALLFLDETDVEYLARAAALPSGGSPAARATEQRLRDTMLEGRGELEFDPATGWLRPVREEGEDAGARGEALEAHRSALDPVKPSQLWNDLVSSLDVVGKAVLGGLSQVQESVGEAVSKVLGGLEGLMLQPRVGPPTPEAQAPGSAEP